MTTESEETLDRTEGAADERIEQTDWESAISDSRGAQIIVAGPGAGKTEFLVRRAAHLIASEQVSASAVLALTFSRRSAADLKKRIFAKIEQTVGGLNASTFHSFAYRFLEHHAPEQLGWAEMPTILTGPEQIHLVSELLAESPENAWPKSFRDLLRTRTFAAEVTDFVLRARERQLGPDALIERTTGRDDWRALPQFLIAYNEALRRLNRIDYGTLQSTAADLLTRPDVQGAAGEQFHYVLVDEYQDTTVAQASILRGLSSTNGNITVVADPYQSIYSFRGAELSNVADFPTDFAGPDGTPAQRRVLATSFRVPAEILAAAERVTAEGSLPGAAGPVDPAPHPGRVEVYTFDQQSEEADWIAGEIARIHIEEETPYSRLAVVVRTKRRLLGELSRALGRRNIPHDEPDGRLIDHPAVQMVFDIVRAARFSESRPDVAPIRRLLLGPLFSLGIAAQRQLERDVRLTSTTWADTIARDVPDGSALAELLKESSWTDTPAKDAFWHVWTTIPQFERLVSDPDQGDMRAALASLSQALSRVNERSPQTTLADYVVLSEADDFEASPLLSFHEQDEDRLTLTTLHQAKGLEFDVVFIADAVEGVLPDMRQRQSLLQTHQLGSHDASTSETQRRLQEEMRLVYTAMTRARSRVIWTATNAGIDEQHQRPSRFLAAVAGPDHEAIGPPDRRTGSPITPQETEAWLRALITDPAVDPHRRLAAAQVLATNSHSEMRAVESFANVLERGVDSGLIPDEMTLSPSQAESYASCPRRYALERRLHVGDPPSYYMEFGLLIHTVLELAEKSAGSEERRSTLAEANDVLAVEFEKYDFGSGSWRKAWRQRAEALLDQLYASWPNPDALAVLLEHPLTLEIDDTTWYGVADRIEQNADGTVRVVDYKTGKSAPTKEEANTSIQLGYYLLAAAHDDHVGAFGAAKHAEYWHPLATSATKRVTTFDPTQIESVRDRLVEIAAGIRSEDWTPSPSERCRTCSVQLVCPAWPEGQEAYAR